MRKFIVLFLLFAQCATPQKQETAEKPAPADPGIDRNEIRKSLATHKKYLSDCYSKSLVTKKGAKLKGTVMIKFLVGPDGRATKPEVIDEKTTLKNQVLNQCLFAGITSWDFPVHPEGKEMDIRFPFHFSDRPPAGMQKKLDKFENLRNR